MTAMTDGASSAAPTLFRIELARLILSTWLTPGPVVDTIQAWVASNMNGPIPWPDDRMFARWAAQRGLSNCNGHIGYRLALVETPGA